MQFHWLNKQNNDKLIIFFTGWSFDHKPFEFLRCENYDVLIAYDYSNLELNSIPDNKEYYLITWSMGVFAAYLLKDKLPKFTKKIAINGTPYPVDDNFGIPVKPFLLTLRHAKTGLEGKFYQNIFNTQNEYDKYLLNPVNRSIENREQELKNIYATIKETEFVYKTFYDKAIISTNDKIIPTKNQIKFWDNKAEIITIESGHFPFYNFDSWNSLL